MPLNEEQRKTLDLGVKKMIEAGASEEDVMAYAEDFNKKFQSHTPPPVKKKDATESASGDGSSVSGRSKWESVVDEDKEARVSRGLRDPRYKEFIEESGGVFLGKEDKEKEEPSIDLGVISTTDDLLKYQKQQAEKEPVETTAEQKELNRNINWRSIGQSEGDVVNFLTEKYGDEFLFEEIGFGNYIRIKPLDNLSEAQTFRVGKVSDPQDYIMNSVRGIKEYISKNRSTEKRKALAKANDIMTDLRFEEQAELIDSFKVDRFVQPVGTEAMTDGIQQPAMRERQEIEFTPQEIREMNKIFEAQKDYLSTSARAHSEEILKAKKRGKVTSDDEAARELRYTIGAMDPLAMENLTKNISREATDIAVKFKRNEEERSRIQNENAKLKQRVDRFGLDEESKAKAKELEQDLSVLTSYEDSLKADLTEIVNMQENLTDAMIVSAMAKENEGNLGGAITNGFIKGTSYIGRLAGMSRQDQEKLIEWMGDPTVTPEWMSSEDRDFWEKLLPSLSESVGIMASSALTGPGAGIARAAGFYAQAYYGMKDEIDQDPNFKDVPEYEKEALASLYGVTIGALEKFGIEFAMGKALGKEALDNIAKQLMRKTFSKSLPKNASAELIEAEIKRDLKKMIADGSIRAIAASGAEGVTETTQELADISLRSLYNMAKGEEVFDNVNWEEFPERALEAGLMGLVGGAIFSGIGQSKQIVSEGFRSVEMTDDIAKTLQLVGNDSKFRSLVSNYIRTEMLSGRLDKETAESVLNSYDEMMGRMNKIPKDVNQVVDAFDLLTEKEKLQKEIEVKDKALTSAQQNRINQIDEQLKTISENAVQEQSTAEVSDVEASRVSEEVEEGASTTEPQVVTEEGKKEVVTDKTVEEQPQTEPVDIDTDIEGTYINVGMLRGQTNEVITEKDIRDNLPSDVDILSISQIDPETGKVEETTSSIELSRALTPEEMFNLRKATDQMAIPQFSGKKGVMYGTLEWGDFNPDYMVLPDGRTMSEAGAKITQPAPTANQITVSNELEFIQQAADKDIETVKAAGRVVKALEKLGVKVFLHNNTDEYNQGISNATGMSKKDIDAETTKSNGEFITDKNEIHINLENADAKTVFHEAFHAVVKAKGFNLSDVKRFVEAVKRSGNLSQETIDKLDRFAEQYSSDSKIYRENLDRISKGQNKMSPEEEAQFRKENPSEIDEEFLSELIGDLAASAETMSQTQLQKLVDAINTLFQKLRLGTPFKGRAERKEIVDFLNGISQSLSQGREIDVTTTGISNIDIINSVNRKKQATIIKNREKTLEEFGLEGKKSYTVREIGAALDKRTKKEFKKFKKDDYSNKAKETISNYIVDELVFELESKDANSAVGWYTEKFQKAIDILAEKDQSLLQKDNRDVFTMFMAVTSDGQKVSKNFELAYKAYSEWNKKGKVNVEAFPKTGDRTASIKGNLKAINRLLSQGKSVSEVVSDLLTEKTVGELKREDKNFKSNYLVSEKVPKAAGIFGEKLGAFYANLSGSTGYLTMDRWWSRTFNRYRGQLIPVIPGSSKDPVDSKGRPKGLAKFKAMIGQPNITDNKALKIVQKEAKAYSDKGFKNGTAIQKAANTIYKAAFINLNDAPFNASDRSFMIETTKIAQKKLKDEFGYDMSIADIQAVLWYFEKRLYKEVGGKDSKDVSYEDVARSEAKKDGLVDIESPDTNLISVSPDISEVNNSVENINNSNLINEQKINKVNRKMQIAPGNRMFNEPLTDAKTIADKYMSDNNIDIVEVEKIKKVDKERAKRISDEYDKMINDPANPEVKEAYEAMVKETMDQYNAITSKGYFVEINNSEPYSSSAEMIQDLKDNKRFKVLSTEAEFGDTPITDAQRKENILLTDSGKKDINGKTLLVNDIFRFVHDFFGHAKLGNSFGPIGEENAWRVHSVMYSDKARRAMTSETRGQNSFVNFSGVNDAVFKKRDKARQLRREGKTEQADKLVGEVYDEMKFADQKIGLMPEWTATEGAPVSRKKQIKGEQEDIFSRASRMESERLKLKSNLGIDFNDITVRLSRVLYGDDRLKSSTIENERVIEEMMLDIIYKESPSSSQITNRKSLINKYKELHDNGVISESMHPYEVELKIAIGEKGFDNLISYYKPSRKKQISGDGKKKAMDDAKAKYELSKKRGNSEAQARESAIADLKKNDWYKESTDIERENAVRELREDLGFKKEKKAPSAAKITGKPKPKKVTVSEVSALKDQIRLEARASREGAQFEKKARKAVFEFLKDRLKGFTGTIKGRRVSAVLNKALTMNLSKPEMQARFLEYVNKVINDADRVTAINNAVKLQKTLKNLAKNKDTQVSTKNLIKEYNALDPVLVENIDEFIAKGKLLHELASKSTARFKKKDGETAADVNLRQRPEMDPIKDYISKEADRAEKIRKNTLMEAYPELVEAGVIDDSMSYLDMKAKIKELETDETAITQEMREALIDEVKEEFKAVQDNFRAIAALGINPVTGEKLTKAQLKAVQDMANISFGDIESLKDALIIRDMMLNFQENGVTDMMAAKARRLIGKAEAKGMAETIDRTPGIKDGISNKIKQTERWYQKTFGQIDNLIIDVFGSKKLALLFKRMTGYSEIENGSSQAELLKSKAMKAYDKLFRKKKANGVNFYNATNEIERVIYARLMRNSGGTIEQISKEFQKNLELEIDNLNYLMREGRHKDAGEVLPSEQREAEAVKEVFDRLGIPTDINKAGKVNMLDIEARVDKVNKQAVQFIIDKWAEHADEIGDVMQLIYNRKLSRDNNYSHTSWRRKNPMDVDIDSMATGAMQALDDGPMDNAPSGALMEANKPSRITDTRRLGYSFESSQFNALEAAMFDVYTASAVAQFNGFMESKHSRSGKIASREDMDLMNKSVKSFYIKAKGTASGATDVDLTGTILGRWIRGAAKYATSLVLGGPLAVLKQSVPAMLTTMWTSGVNATTKSVTTYWANKSKIDSLIDDSGVDVSVRGVKSIADVYTGGDTKRDKTFFRKVLGIPNKLADFWIDKFLVWSDKGVAKATFIAYYMQSIKRQGGEFSLDKPLKSNMEAFEYAKMMTNLYQNASNDKVMGDVFSTKNQGVSFIRQTLFPYASFLQNFKTRTYTDVKIVAKNLGYKWKDLKDSEAKQAMNGIIGSIQEIGTYALLRSALAYGIWYLTKQMTGWDEEEEDPEILREINRRKDRYFAKTKKPLPDQDKMLSVKEANKIAKELGIEKVYDIPTKFSTIHDDLVGDIAWNIMYEKEKKKLMTSLIQDVLSPMPATDDVVKGAFNEYILLPGQKAILDKDFNKAVEEENEIRRTTGKENMNPEQLKKFKEDYERDNYFSLYQGGGENNQFGVLSIAPRAVMDLAASYKAGANGEVIDDNGKVIGYLVGKDAEYAKMNHNINATRTLLLTPPDIARGFTSSASKINKKSMLTPSEKTTYDIAVELTKKIGLDPVSEDEIKKIRSNEYKDVEELLAYRGEDKIDRNVRRKVQVVNAMSKLSGLNTLQVLSRITKSEFDEFNTRTIKAKFDEEIKKTITDRAKFKAAQDRLNATWEKAVAAAMR